MNYFFCTECTDVFEITDDYQIDSCLFCGGDVFTIAQSDFIELNQVDSSLNDYCTCEDYPCCAHGGM